MNDDEGFTLVVRIVCKFIRWMMIEYRRIFGLPFKLMANVYRRCGRLIAIYSRRIFENSNTLIKKIRVITSKSVGDITPM